jgi:hypothetical protein
VTTLGEFAKFRKATLNLRRFAPFWHITQHQTVILYRRVLFFLDFLTLGDWTDILSVTSVKDHDSTLRNITEKHRSH